MKSQPAALEQEQKPSPQPHYSHLKTGFDFSPQPPHVHLNFDVMRYFFFLEEKLHGRSFPSWWISEICTLGAQGMAELWSLLLRTARARVQSSASSPSTALQPVWVPREPSSTEAQGVMGTRTMPTRVPVLTLLTRRAGADVAAHRVGASGIPQARHSLCALIDICQDNAVWHREKYLGQGLVGALGSQWPW